MLSNERQINVSVNIYAPRYSATDQYSRTNEILRNNKFVQYVKNLHVIGNPLKIRCELFANMAEDLIGVARGRQPAAHRRVH